MSVCKPALGKVPHTYVGCIYITQKAAQYTWKEFHSFYNELYYVPSTTVDAGAIYTFFQKRTNKDSPWANGGDSSKMGGKYKVAGSSEEAQQEALI